jgi:NADH dehydrogenase/NADH:ubiquinone oxidoreductase subunit G
MDYFPNRCVLCERCINVCRKKHGSALMSFANRGLNTVISFYGEHRTEDLPCHECGACIDICPVAALMPKKEGIKSEGGNQRQLP